MQPIVRGQQVFINVNTGEGGAGSSKNFPAVQELEGVLIVGVQTFNADTGLTNTTDQVACISAADALKVVVTFNEGSDQRFKQMPLSEINALLNAGIWPEFEPFRIAWQQSRVEFNAAVTAQRTIPFFFMYIREEDAPELFAQYRK